VRLIESGNARSEQLLVVPSAYRVANQQRMTARRALEWIGALKPGWFLDMKYHTCSPKILVLYHDVTVSVNGLVNTIQYELLRI